MTSHKRFAVTISLSCTDSQLWWHAGQKLKMFPTPRVFGAVVLNMPCINKWSKNFDERLHHNSSRYRGQNDPVCCVHRSKGSECFSVSRTTSKITPSRAGSQSPSNNGSLGPRQSAPNGIWIGSQTDRQTDEPRQRMRCGLIIHS